MKIDVNVYFSHNKITPPESFTLTREKNGHFLKMILCLLKLFQRRY